MTSIIPVDFRIYQSGIYHLFSCGELVYIGLSNNFMRRLVGHLREGKKLFDHYAFFPMVIENIEEMEKKVINAFFMENGFLPKYNKLNGTTKVFHPNRARKTTTEEAIQILAMAAQNKSPFKRLPARRKNAPLDMEDIQSRTFNNALQTAIEALYITQELNQDKANEK